MQTIAVYGSSMVQADSPEYLDALAVGRALGQAGYAIMTGSYEGVMEAASRGAAEAGSHVIGVTSAPIEAIRRIGPNQWVDQIIPYNTLRDRLMHLILQADGYVVMPGGIGTFNELLLAWELIRVKEIAPRPLVCYGDYWQQILEPLQQTHYIRDGAWDLLLFANTPDEVVEAIARSNT